jgi:hypothetical protein
MRQGKTFNFAAECLEFVSGVISQQSVVLIDEIGKYAVPKPAIFCRMFRFVSGVISQQSVVLIRPMNNLFRNLKFSAECLDFVGGVKSQQHVVLIRLMNLVNNLFQNLQFCCRMFGFC